jgi:hypothetical protein
MKECDLEAREQWQWNDLEIIVARILALVR